MLSEFNLLILICLTLPPSLKCFPLDNEDDNIVGNKMPDLSYLGDRIYKEPDQEVGKRLETWNTYHPMNPEEFGEYAEGDILFPKGAKNGLLGESFRWKNGIVPYEISGLYSSNDLNIISKAMEIYKKYTCVRKCLEIRGTASVQTIPMCGDTLDGTWGWYGHAVRSTQTLINFRPRVITDHDYISITNGNTGCWSSVGKIGGRQVVNLKSPSCTTKVGTALHELMHAIGFLHEQNRYERDDYVTIAWQHIQKGHENNFDKASKETSDGFGVSYDYKSVMHYSSGAFSANGKPTIVPKDPKKAEKMGQRDGFSRGDITKINLMYSCPEKTSQVLGGGQIMPATENTTNSNINREEGTTNILQQFLTLFKH